MRRIALGVARGRGSWAVLGRKEWVQRYGNGRSAMHHSCTEADARLVADRPQPFQHRHVRGGLVSRRESAQRLRETFQKSVVHLSQVGRRLRHVNGEIGKCFVVVENRAFDYALVCIFQFEH